MLKKLPVLFLISIASLAVGFANQLLISKFFGTTSNLDAYWFIISLINFLGFYASPLRDSVSPLFFKKLNNLQSATQLASAAVSLCIYIALGEILLLGGLLYATITGVMPNSLELSHEMIQVIFWLIPSILLITVIEVMAGLLLVLNMPIQQAICRFILPCITFLFLFLFASSWGEITLAVAFTIANLLVMGISLLYLYKANIKIRIASPKDLIEPSIKSMFWMMALVYVFAQLHAFYERYVFLQFGPGVISSFQYAFILVTTLIGLISGPICNLLWPYFMAMEQNIIKKDQGNVLDSLWIYLGAPLLILATFIFFNAYPIIYFLFYRGEFNLQSTQTTSNALMFLIFAIIPACVSQVIVRLLNAQNNFYGIGAVGIVMASIGILLLSISILENNLDLALSQWFIANLAGVGICMFVGYWRIGSKNFLTLNRFKLLFKFLLIVILAFYFSPRISVTESKLNLGLDLLTSFASYFVPLTLGLILLNLNNFRFLAVLKRLLK